MTPATVGELLGDTQDVVARIASATASGRPDLTRTAGPLRARIRDAVAALLDIDLGDLLLDGWTTYRELRDAARRSVDAPGSEERVGLDEHRVVSTHRPRVEIWVDDQVVRTVELDVEVVFSVHALDAVVRDGRLVGLESGNVEVGASLSSGDRTIVGKTIPFPVGALVALGRGVPLLGETRDPAGAAAPAADAGERRPGPVARRRGPRVAVALLVVALAAGGVVAVAVPASAWPWASAGVGGVVVPGRGWNMRAGPSARTSVVDVARPGQPVEVLCLDRGWAKLTEPRAGVYVDRRGLRLDGDPPPCT